MIRSIKTSLTGLKSHLTAADMVAHNVANVNTTSFKAVRASFADLPYSDLEPRRMPVSPLSPAVPPQVGTGVRVSASAVSYEQGHFVHTGRRSNLAIEGEGFFRVLLPEGRIAYTRSGDFQLDARGNLVTASGALLEPLLELANRGLDPSSLEITPQGLVRAMEDGTPVELGRILLYRFPNPSGLVRVGAGMLQPTAASGEAQAAFPGEGDAGQLHQGYLEESNVDLAEEMVTLIKAHRGMQSNARALITADELWALSNQLQR